VQKIPRLDDDLVLIAGAVAGALAERQIIGMRRTGQDFGEPARGVGAGRGAPSGGGRARDLSWQAPVSEAERRINIYWRPYHQMLAKLLDQSRAAFGEAILVDCHSMPHEAMDMAARGLVRRPEIVIGDRHGASASAEIVDRLDAAFTAVGLHVVRNVPFAGAYICQTYGRPSRGQHAIQIEIDRSIYMNEQMIRPNGNFEAFRGLLKTVTAEVCEIGRKEAKPLAAE